MTFTDIKQSTKVYRLGVAIERFFPLPSRLRLARALGFFVIVSLAGALLFSIFTASPDFAARLSVSEGLLTFLRYAPGVFYIALACWLAVKSFRGMYAPLLSRATLAHRFSASCFGNQCLPFLLTRRS